MNQHFPKAGKCRIGESPCITQIPCNPFLRTNRIKTMRKQQTIKNHRTEQSKTRVELDLRRVSKPIWGPLKLVSRLDKLEQDKINMQSIFMMSVMLCGW